MSTYRNRRARRSRFRHASPAPSPRAGERPRDGEERAYVPSPCPAWCQTDHAKDDPHGFREHRSTVATVNTPIRQVPLSSLPIDGERDAVDDARNPPRDDAHAVTQPAGHALFDRWTGRHASALQAALRMSQDEMAARLGVAKRTIASWHERPNVVIRPELQRALDTAYEQAPEAAKIRFARQLSAGEAADIKAAGTTVALTVAIAVVVTDTDVLIVCRREPDPSGITWQFPAGIVKPGASASTVAVRETLAETGIHCAIRAALGSRIHPLSGVNCEYFLCEYLAGDVENRDILENVDALWVPKREVTRFIPADKMFEPIMRQLEREA